MDHSFEDDVQGENDPITLPGYPITTEPPPQPSLVIAELGSPVPYLTGTFGLAYLVVVVPADLVMLYAAYEAFADPTAGQTHLKYGMFLAAAAFIVGRLAVIGLP